MSKKKYHHKQIEMKWQKQWLENKTFHCEVDRNKPKYYILDMFPYPSGAGLHVGHVEGYTATDILSRYKRMQGFNVMHPIGWDSFGLPAEQYAIRTGTHPAETTEKNINTFRTQLRKLGYSYDWDREFATSDPKYYKWTQWIFTKLYDKGLAYEAEMLVNFCPGLGTVLSNEEIVDGKSLIGGHPVERRPLRQWILKITDYAERLLEDLDLLDWPEGLKKLQRNWIGKSYGAEVHFSIDGHPKENIEIYTTRPNTLFGATYMVLAPEHHLVEKITTPEHKESVDNYCRKAASKSDMNRTELAKDKTGVFTGAYAINPVNSQKIPIWIGDYVLISYGTGAIMSVPAHDERDFAFATKYELPIVSVYDPIIEEHPELIPEGMSNKQVHSAISKGKLCWTGEGYATHSENSEISLNGLKTQDSIKKIIDWLEKKGLGKGKVNFKLRDWLFSRQRYWGEPFPILHFEDGSKRVLDLDELPLCPPEINDYKPSSDGRSPLSTKREWMEVTDSKTGKKALRESNTMPQWAGSCWYYLRFVDPLNDREAFDKIKESYWMPVDLYVGGVEHAVLHLLYARFWHKVLYDLGIVSTAEPFMSLRNQGLIVSRSFQDKSGAYVEPEHVIQKDNLFYHEKTGEVLSSQVEKMSKSKLNGVNPDDIIEEFGADSLRLYEMFMGPLEKEKIWNTDAVNGCRRFLSRLYDLATSEKVTEENTEEALKLGHRLLHGVQKDTEKLLFNTAIAKMMEFVNDFSKLPAYPKEVLKMAVHVLCPYAPHVAEEMWEILGGTEELAYKLFPPIDEKYLQDEMRTYVIQINGKVRGRLELPKDQPKEVIIEAAKSHPTVAKYLSEAKIKKVIFVPNKLLSLVI